MSQKYIGYDGRRFSNTGFKMPALFVGHGNPMNAIEATEFSRALAHRSLLWKTQELL